MAKKVSKPLSLYLDDAGLTYQDMATATGIHRTVIAKYAKGLIEPSISKAKLIENASRGIVSMEEWADYWIELKENKKKFG